MHEGQVDLDAAAVGRLVAGRYPRWAGLPVRPVVSSGTVNALFLLGERIVLRFPLHPNADPAVVERARAAQTVAARIPTTVALPELLGVAAPHDLYPGWSTAYRWLEGELVDPAAPPPAIADDLADFVRAVQAVPLDVPLLTHSWRSGPLAAVDAEVRSALRASRTLLDVAPLEAVWADALAAPGPPTRTWLHTDLMPGNLLVQRGRLAAVLDCEDIAVGDPSVDLMPAWNLIGDALRSRFRARVAPTEPGWRRGRGWALAQAILALPYYVDTNPHMASTASRTLAALIRDAA